MAEVKEVIERLAARISSEDEGGSEAAAERAMMGMEAQADLWAERVNLADMIRNLVHVNRLPHHAPDAVRDSFIKRQGEQFDAVVRQSFLEGFLEGGLSRKAYDQELDGSATAALSTLLQEREELREALSELIEASQPFAPGNEGYDGLAEDHIRNAIGHAAHALSDKREK